MGTRRGYENTLKRNRGKEHRERLEGDCRETSAPRSHRLCEVLGVLERYLKSKCTAFSIFLVQKLGFYWCTGRLRYQPQRFPEVQNLLLSITLTSSEFLRTAKHFGEPLSLAEEPFIVKQSDVFVHRAQVLIPNNKFSILSLKRKGIGFCRVMAEPSRNMEVEKLISYTDDLVKVLVEPRDLNNLSYCHQQNLSLSSSSHSHHQDVRSSLQDCEKKVDACKQKIEEARSETVADAELDLLQRELEEELEKEPLYHNVSYHLFLISTAIGDEFNDLEQQWISVQEQKKALQKIEKTKLRAQTTEKVKPLHRLKQRAKTGKGMNKTGQHVVQQMSSQLPTGCHRLFQCHSQSWTRFSSSVQLSLHLNPPGCLYLSSFSFTAPKTRSSLNLNVLRMILSMYASVTNIVPDLGEQSKISGCILWMNLLFSAPSSVFSDIVDKDKNAVEKFEYDTSKMTAFDICNGVWKIISE
ncbi:hypothetical protein V8G54_020472 [Vigna mungo]|uniref:Uncharacterized protein n=1 Tax=Vigna mungo TaxID=3915 RepID=A0AAQ3RWQ9_VIGMU